MLTVPLKCRFEVAHRLSSVSRVSRSFKIVCVGSEAAAGAAFFLPNRFIATSAAKVSCKREHYYVCEEVFLINTNLLYFKNRVYANNNSSCGLADSRLQASVSCARTSAQNVQEIQKDVDPSCSLP
jgi:hypothetical protein